MPCQSWGDTSGILSLAGFEGASQEGVGMAVNVGGG
jgi:hypothetical protein